MSNYIHYKVWDDITYPLHRWSLGMDKKFHPNILLAVRLLIHVGIKVKPC